MTAGLSAQQRDALQRYAQLRDDHPALFRGRARRPIVLDPAVLEDYAARTGDVLGVALATPYLWLVNDLVRSTTDSGPVLHPYLRMIAPPAAQAAPGVVVLATITEPGAAPLVVLVRQERHSTGTVELELPRGFGEPGTPRGVQALAELQQETGYVGAEPEHLGTTLTDSGITDGCVAFFHVAITSQVALAPEPGEAIAATVLLPLDELWDQIDAGLIRDSFTLQALALYQRRAVTRCRRS